MYKVTDYVLQVMTRWVMKNEHRAKEYINTEDREKFNDFEQKVGNFEVSYYLNYEEDDDDGNIFPQVLINVRICRDGCFSPIFNKPYAENEAKDIVDEMILALKGKEFSFCKSPYCKRIAEEEGLCESCYIHDWHRGEECCVCKEDGGRWAQLECGHILHDLCFIYIKGWKCPLCRHQCDPLKIKGATF